MLNALLPLYSREHTLESVEKHLLREIDSLEFCLRRDRINHNKPE